MTGSEIASVVVEQMTHATVAAAARGAVQDAVKEEADEKKDAVKEAVDEKKAGLVGPAGSATQ